MIQKFQNQCLQAYIYLTYFCAFPLLAFCIALTPFASSEQRGICFLGAILLTAGIGIYPYIKKLFEKRISLALFPLILFSAICLRLSFFPYISRDFINFLHPWIEKMSMIGWPYELAFPITNYNLLYTYVLAGISHIPFSDLYLIKSVSVVFDCILGITLLTILKRCLHLNDWLALGGSALVLLAPSLLLNSAAWGQCDSLYTALALIGIYLCIQESPWKGCLCLGIALALKLQAVFLFPVLIILLFYKEIRVQHLLVIPIVYVVCALPAAFLGRPIWDILTIYGTQIGTYDALTQSAPTLWAIFPAQLYTNLLPVALCSAGLIVMLMTFGILLLRPIKNKLDFLDVAFIYTLVMPYVLPKMHERYFYIATALSVIYLFRYPKLWWVTIGIMLIDACAYFPYLFGFSVIPLPWLSLGLLLIIIKVILHFFSTPQAIEIDQTGSTKAKPTIIAFVGLLLGVLMSAYGTVFMLNLSIPPKTWWYQPHTFHPYWLPKSNIIQAQHPHWRADLLRFSDTKLVHIANMDIADIVYFDEKTMTLHWLNGPTEKFIKTKDDIYTFQGKVNK